MVPRQAQDKRNEKLLQKMAFSAPGSPVSATFVSI